MKKKVLFLSLLLMVGLVGCNENKNDEPTTGTIPGTTTATSSSSLDTRTDLEKIRDLIIGLQTNQNYTMVINDSDGEWKSRILPNATYYNAPGYFDDIDTRGYAENETGIFAYLIGEEGLTLKSNYLKDDDGNNLHDIYTAKVNKNSSSVRMENVAYSFKLFDVNNLEGLEESRAVPGMYNIDYKKIIDVIPAIGIQDTLRYQEVQARLGLSENGLIIQYKATCFGTDLGTYTLEVKDIGTTTIPYITEYLQEGKGPSEDVLDSDENKLKKLLDDKNYIVSIDENTNYIVTSNYVQLSIWDEENETEIVKGFVSIEDNSVLDNGIYEYTVDSATGNVRLGNKTDYESMIDLDYFIPTDIFDICTFADEVYTCEDATLLSQYEHYIDNTLDDQKEYIGKLYISYNLRDGNMESYSTITIVADHYDVITKKPSGKQTTKTISSFGAASDSDYATYIENFLQTLAK